MRALYLVAYWLLFFAVLTNVDLGVSVAGVALNFQRLVFAAVVAFLVVDIGSNPGRRLLLPNYVLVLLTGYCLLFMLELYHGIRLQSFDEVGLQFGLTLCLIVVLAFLKSYSAGLTPKMTWLSAIFLISIVVTIMQSADLATASQSLVLDGNFNNSMRLRSSDARNIVNSWAAGVVISFVFLNDLCWQHTQRKWRRILLLSLAAIAGLVTLLSASRAALALFVIGLALVGVREVRYGGKIGMLGAVLLWAGVGVLAVEFLRESALFLRIGDLSSGDDTSLLRRLSAFTAVADRIDAAFLIGHGKARGIAAVATENTFLSVTYRYGIVGLAVYTGMWAVILTRAFLGGGTRGFFNSILVTFASLLTNDLLFFPLALFVIIEALQFDSQRRFHRIGLHDPDGGAQPAQGIGRRPG